jgi:hypothetical protein
VRDPSCPGPGDLGTVALSAAATVDCNDHYSVETWIEVAGGMMCCSCFFGHIVCDRV